MIVIVVLPGRLSHFCWYCCSNKNIVQKYKILNFLNLLKNMTFQRY